MQWTSDAEQIVWIRDRLDSFEKGCVVSHVPRGFEAYARVLHPVPSPVGEGEVAWSEVAKWSGAILQPQSSFRQISQYYDQRDNLVYWPTNPYPGTLEPWAAARLLNILSSQTPSVDSCYFAVWEGRSWVWGGNTNPALNALSLIPASILGAPRAWLPNRSYILYSGRLEDATALQYLTDSGAVPPEELPNLWWPVDRSWCVAMEIDLVSTYVGGSADLVARLVADSRLEVQVVSPETPVS